MAAKPVPDEENAVGHLVALLAEDPASTALFSDFDGTLSPIVADAFAAHPLPGAVEALARLAGSLRRVAVLSGRPLEFLAPLVTDPVDISALYGLQQRVGGRWGEHPAASSWRVVVAAAVEEGTVALAALGGVSVEPKGLSLTVHFRNALDPGTVTEACRWADAAAARTGLVLRIAKASVELHPPIAASKGTVLSAWAAGARTVAFFGDDVGDLPAFEAIAELRKEGVRAVAVAVGGDELPAAVAGAADVVMRGPPVLASLLQDLVAAVAAAS